MVLNRISERRAEALAAERRRQDLRAHLMPARKSTSPTLEHRDSKTTPMSRHAALLKKARARLQHLNAARLRRSQPNAEKERPNENLSRSLELQWLTTHRQAYPGLWLALEGDVLVASSKSLIEALRQARDKGFANPLVAWSEDIPETPFGGW
jgi:hypothetical protein